MSRGCCCGEGGQITCDEWCTCLPQRATLQGLSIDVVQKSYCGNTLTQERTIALNITQTKLVITPLCYMASDATSGTWSWLDRTRVYSSPPNGVINYPGCPDVACRYTCDVRELCRTYTTSGNGTNPELIIRCANPCQGIPITDAFSRLDWQVQGDVFTDTDTGSNAYPDLNAYLACRFPSPPNNPALQHGPCSSYFNSTIGPYYSFRGGSILGRRGCLTSQSFSQFNACNSILRMLDPNVDPPDWNPLCPTTLGLPTCYSCAGGTMVPNFQISNVTYSVQCNNLQNACCDTHICNDWQNTTNSPIELFCCGNATYCVACQLYNGQTYLPGYTTLEWTVQLNVTVP